MSMSSDNAKLMESPTHAELPEGVLVAWYGDDFTGAAAVMEVLAFAGLPAILFLDVPTETQLRRFQGLRGIGVASTARAQSPEWMKGNLPSALEKLGKFSPELLHYKVCSTLDSSPEVGSIGCAIELGTQGIDAPVVPIVTAAPRMGRFQCFGHLFASVGDEVVRLDRHPVMSRHPVTPMTEADVAAHVKNQSDRIDTQLVSLVDLGDSGTILPSSCSDSTRISLVSLDTVDARSDAEVGRILWEARQASPFVVGSQGVEYALVEHWVKTGQLPRREAPPRIGRAEQMMSVSGSVSPTTAQQIAWSADNGFACIEFDATVVCGGEKDIAQEVERVAQLSFAALSDGKDPLVHSAAGPDDPSVAKFNQAVDTAGMDIHAANQTVGKALGKVLDRVLTETNLRRAIVSGGDTSGFATQQLGIFALSALAPTIPGASIFQAHSENRYDGLELALKGGQMGTPDYFGWVREGGGER